MGITIQQSIPVNSRGFFLRERDSLSERFGVKLMFPRGREFMHGTHQTMLMVGLQRNINNMMPHIRRILADANDQYQGYKQRQIRRREMNPRPTYPVVKAHIHPTQKPRLNAFQALDGLFEQEQKEIEMVNLKRAKADNVRQAKKDMKKRELDAIASGLAPKSCEVIVNTMNFAAAASKPKVEQTPTKHLEYTRGEPKNMSWADMADEDEEEETTGWNNETW